MTPKIVVFSPQMFFLRSVAEALSGHGFHIVPKMQVLNSVPEIEQQQPDLVIVDTQSAALTSVVDTIQEVKTTPQLADIPIILANSTGNKSPIPQLPGVAVLGWPVDSNRLLDCVRQLLGASAG